jgi:hypothetical protein
LGLGLDSQWVQIDTGFWSTKGSVTTVSEVDWEGLA